MKNLILGIIALSIFSLHSCKKGNDPVPVRLLGGTDTISGPMLGKWYFESLEEKNGKRSTHETYHSKSFDEQGFWEFKSDGTFTIETRWRLKRYITSGFGGPEYLAGTSAKYSRSNNGAYSFSAQDSIITIGGWRYNVQFIYNRMVLSINVEVINRDPIFGTGYGHEEFITLSKQKNFKANYSLPYNNLKVIE